MSRNPNSGQTSFNNPDGRDGDLNKYMKTLSLCLPGMSHHWVIDMYNIGKCKNCKKDYSERFV